MLILRMKAVFRCAHNSKVLIDVDQHHAKIKIVHNQFIIDI